MILRRRHQELAKMEAHLLEQRSILLALLLAGATTAGRAPGLHQRQQLLPQHAGGCLCTVQHLQGGREEGVGDWGKGVRR